MDTWRLLSLETNNAFMNMAIDEAILTARIDGKVPNTLRFYRWQPSAVSIGKNQIPDVELYLDACKQQGVDVVRRISGGGTVYHDFEGEVTYMTNAPRLSWLNNTKGWVEGMMDQKNGEATMKVYAEKPEATATVAAPMM